MIKTFADRHTQEVYEKGKSRRFPPDIRGRAIRRLEYIDHATGLEDLKVPPSNRLHELERERNGQYFILVNDQWRICFRFEDGGDNNVDPTEYHGGEVRYEHPKHKRAKSSPDASWRDASRGFSARLR